MIGKLEAESKRQTLENIPLQIGPSSSGTKYFADVLGNLSCKPSNFRKRVRKVINKAKLRGGSSKCSEANCG
jgi:hypothetical protein